MSTIGYSEVPLLHSIPCLLCFPYHGEEVWVLVYDHRQQLVQVSLVVGQVLFQGVHRGHHLGSSVVDHVVKLQSVVRQDALQILHVDSVLPHCLHGFLFFPLELLEFSNLRQVESLL